ncbi:UDP-glucose 4-epimerase GalE [Mycoplasmopsis alligatoris]|uniref:UDP-glucose 4-epimerase n=1 Tax=Mycoplasmopsis alligatoris A21JP2 TaxID=747682 RepID=D4XW30_9BACT|nr:UDP-glucose 4-epimerase GalE [Mycoplasmopsis alligatoris]EFF41450.1 UDP-glucose 4-epimerase [Mycoplasmopsis alligatoris A21JP2]
MKVLVCGGAGYIGGHTVWSLYDKGYDIVVFDNLSTGNLEYLPKNITFIKGDITNKKDLDELFKKHDFDCIMDFAAKIVVPESVIKPLEYFFNNTEGVRLLIEKVVEKNIKNFIFSSTAAVYGQIQSGICDENSFLNPINPYGDSKLAAEKIIQSSAYAYKFNYAILRYFNVAGADSKLRCGLKSNNLSHIVPIMTNSMLNKSIFKIFGDDYNTKDKTCIRDYVHVSDVALAHVKALEYLVNSNKSIIANLGSNDGFSVKQVVDEGLKYHNFKYEYASRRAGDPDKLIASNKIAKEFLKWEPKISLKEMIKSDFSFRKKLKNTESK